MLSAIDALCLRWGAPLCVLACRPPGADGGSALRAAKAAGVLPRTPADKYQPTPPMQGDLAAPPPGQRRAFSLLQQAGLQPIGAVEGAPEGQRGAGGRYSLRSRGGSGAF